MTAPKASANGNGVRRLLTADQVAAYLQVNKSFVYSLTRENRIPHVKLGERYVRYRLDAIEAWVASKEVAA